MKGKVCRVTGQGHWNTTEKPIKCADFFLFVCPCDGKRYGLFCTKPHQSLLTHCPDCGNELEESNDLKDFERKAETE